jgi:hypothetical protein
MSDSRTERLRQRLSPENLGKELYIQHEIFVSGITPPEANADWNTILSSDRKKHWILAAASFCQYLKEAQKDS